MNIRGPSTIGDDTIKKKKRKTRQLPKSNLKRHYPEFPSEVNINFYTKYIKKIS